jgi:hypothetical protein
MRAAALSTVAALVVAASPFPGLVLGKGVAPHSSPSQAGTALRVDATYFAPATVTQASEEDNSTANVFRFRQDHSASYDALGRVDGYLELAAWNTPTGRANFYYQGSVMSDAAHALAAKQDNVTVQTVKLSAQTFACPLTGATSLSCTYMVTQDAAHTTWYADYVWAVGSCLIESEAVYSQSEDAATSTTIRTTLSVFTYQASVLAQSLCGSQPAPSPTPTGTSRSAPTATPTATAPVAPSPTARPTKTSTPQVTATATPRVSSGAGAVLLSARVEKSGAKADLSRPPATTVKAGQKILLAIYVEFETGAAPGAATTFSFVAQKGKTQVFSKTLQAQVPASLPAELREAATTTLKSAGKYKFTGTITFQGKSSKRSSSFQVAAAAKKQCVTIGGTQYCN